MKGLPPRSTSKSPRNGSSWSVRSLMSLLAVPRAELSCLHRPSLVTRTLLLESGPAKSSAPLAGPPWDRVPFWIEQGRAGRTRLCGVMLGRAASRDRASEGVRMPSTQTPATRGKVRSGAPPLLGSCPDLPQVAYHPSPALKSAVAWAAGPFSSPGVHAEGTAAEGTPQELSTRPPTLRHPRAVSPFRPAS